jgi:hypothetical protein
MAQSHNLALTCFVPWPCAFLYDASLLNFESFLGYFLNLPLVLGIFGWHIVAGALGHQWLTFFFLGLLFSFELSLLNLLVL